jgi:Flp pilus assembly protein protease CpaA
MIGPQGYVLSMCAVAGVAAAFDWKTGRIPNAFAIAALLVAVPAHVYLSPPGRSVDGLESSALGAVLCTLPFLIGWRLGWVAGGDVKLVAAMGAAGGISFGLEAVFLALLSAASFIVLRFAWNGTLLRTLTESVGLRVARALVQNKKLTVTLPAPQPSLRFGPFALAGSALSFAIHGGFA